jgi:aromatic ring-cleaving dioxygenase
MAWFDTPYKEVAMPIQLSVTEEQLALLVELLEHERHELPVEIHHADNPDVHDDLKARMKKVDELTAMLRKASAAMV